MNLQSIAVGYIATVNPQVPVLLQVSTGTTQSADFKQIPTYAAAVTVQAQIQALTFRDITQVNGLNLQGTRHAIYLNGDIEGLVRATNRGGDLITFPDGSVYLVALVLEYWLGSDGGWTKCACTLQDGA